MLVLPVTVVLEGVYSSLTEEMTVHAGVAKGSH